MRSSLRFAIIWAVVSTMVVCLAQEQPAHLNRHARKVQRSLADYPPGSFLHIVLHDRSDRFGELGKKTSTSFELLDTKTREPASFTYSDVRKLDVGSTIEGNGWGHHWPHVRLVPLTIVAAAAVAGAMTFAVMRN
jgi:hypothetical protein